MPRRRRFVSGEAAKPAGGGGEATTGETKSQARAWLPRRNRRQAIRRSRPFSWSRVCAIVTQPINNNHKSSSERPATLIIERCVPGAIVPRWNGTTTVRWPSSLFQMWWLPFMRTSRQARMLRTDSIRCGVMCLTTQPSRRSHSAEHSVHPAP